MNAKTADLRFMTRVFQAENPYWHLVDFWEKGGVLHIENRMLVCTGGMITIGKMQDHLRVL